ncbi:MAG: DUF4367 domain-containing protein [Tyzzerella sp.]|nr:DUF4367 domain-containing protein [Tyzzerella sp.]
MSEKKWKEFIQREMDKELEEIEGVLEKINNDPVMREWKAPDGLHDKVLEQIRESQADTERLSDDEKELIRLGMVYKKRRKWNKLLVLAAAVVCALAVGVTSIGGPKKVIEKVQGMIEGREQIHNDSEDDRTKEIKTISEVEAYQKIEDEFGFLPVKLFYMPDGIEFDEIIITEGAENIYLNYIGDNQESIIYFIYPNYRTGSIGRDVEDKLIDEYEKVVNDNTISIKEYYVEGNQSSRYKVSFDYQNVHYYLEINNIEKQEVEKIIENLYFN